MIIAPSILVPPFAVPDLIWRETAFAISEAANSCSGSDPLGPMRVDLPADLTRAVAKRRCEFLAGRLCAALALRAAGLPVNVGRKGRAPIWPEGATGSISHCDGRAIAVVSTRHPRLGVDCEPVMSVARAAELAEALVSPGELALITPLTHAAFVTLAFSAKEALYKALSPDLDRIPGFLEAEVRTLSPDRLIIGFDGRDWPVLWRIDEGLLCRTLALDPI